MPHYKTDKQAKLLKLIKLPSSKSDWEFTSVLISRPINYVILKLIGDFQFITPNFITLLGFASFLVASYFLFSNNPVLASIFLFLRLILDDLDGMTARYKGQGSNFGSYLDKITDVFGFAVYFGMLGYIVHLKHNSIVPLFAAFVAIFSLVVTGYVKWVVTAMNPITYHEKTAIKHKFNLTNLFILFLKLFVVNECDLFLFSIIFILAGKIEWLLLFIFATQSLQMLVMVIKRGFEAYLIDKQHKM